MEIFSNIILGLLITWLVIQIFFRYVSKNQIDLLIVDHYKKQGIEVEEINKLTITERIKYGVSLNIILRMYGFMYTLFTRLGESHFRKVETIDKNQKEQIRYVDLYVRKRKLIEFKEFDKYDI